MNEIFIQTKVIRGQIGSGRISITLEFKPRLKDGLCTNEG